jgi:hypothetical protein
VPSLRAEKNQTVSRAQFGWLRKFGLSFNIHNAQPGFNARLSS